MGTERTKMKDHCEMCGGVLTALASPYIPMPTTGKTFATIASAALVGFVVLVVVLRVAKIQSVFVLMQ
jgi:hypothetical protein